MNSLINQKVSWQEKNIICHLMKLHISICITKIDGRLIRKKRYMIPLNDSLTIELDVFEGDLAPLLLAEVEFPDEASALSFTPPEWFGTDVTFSSEYHNSTLSLK